MENEAKGLNDEVCYYYEWNTWGIHLIIKTLDADFSNTNKHYSKVEIFKVFDEDYCVGETYYWRSNSAWKPVPNPDAIQQNKRHKHADLIIAWANGEEIEWFDPDLKVWETVTSPLWHSDGQYRVKQKKKEPIVRTMFVDANPYLDNSSNEPNLRLTFDAESGKLLSAEVLS